MRKPETLDGSKTPAEWWKHLKWMKRVVHKATRKRNKVLLQKRYWEDI